MAEFTCGYQTWIGGRGGAGCLWCCDGIYAGRVPRANWSSAQPQHLPKHHRAHGWKNAKAGICRAKVGVIRRVSMVVLRETARHSTRGLEIVGPQCVQERAARRARSSAAEADMDEFRAGIHNDRGFGNDFRNERGQAA